MIATPIAIELFKASLPASNWMQVEDVFVYDAALGNSPGMRVKRRIHTEFTAEWVAEVYQQQPSGRFSTVCTQDGRNEYAPGERLPDNLDLDWWTYPKACKSGMGQYKVVTV